MWCLIRGLKASFFYLQTNNEELHRSRSAVLYEEVKRDRNVRVIDEGREMVVRFAVEVTGSSWRMDYTQSRCSALSLKDTLADKIPQERLWSMLFADDIVICFKSTEQVRKILESISSGGKKPHESQDSAWMRERTVDRTGERIG